MPRRLKGYVLGETLGSGLQGKVKLAVHEATRRAVALKVIDREKMGKREELNLYKEVEAMKRLAHHPHIVQLLDVHVDALYPKKNGQFKPVILIVLELAQGGELFDFMMHTGCFPENIARTFFRQLISGVEMCHFNGVYHRDIKPENLLLDKHFGLKIADFGLSALHETENGTLMQLYTQCGTRGYMSPELLSGNPYDGAAADIWSCGVVLFIMLAGFPPFQIAQRQDWWFRAISMKKYDAFWEAHARSVTFSAGAMSLLNRIFVAEPSERITLNAIKEHPWFCENDFIRQDMLYKELQNRKNVVEKQKQYQRMLKQQHANPAISEEFDPFDQNVMRSIQLDSQDVCVEGEVEEEEEEKVSMTLPEYSQNKTTRYTNFYSRLGREALCRRIEQALSAMSANFKVNGSTGKIKATLDRIELVVQMYTSSEDDSVLVTEIRRRNGGLLKFHEAYKVLCSHLTDVICEAPIVVTKTELGENEPKLADSVQLI